jgi:hypothetical protein
MMTKVRCCCCTSEFFSEQRTNKGVCEKFLSMKLSVAIAWKDGRQLCVLKRQYDVLRDGERAWKRMKSSPLKVSGWEKISSPTDLRLPDD